MFRKVLIANRGEIALRVIRAAREMGLQSVAVYSTADAESLHVKFADQAVCIGPAPAKASYLNIPAIISAAEITGADAVHPGYGFLSEDPHFADVAGRCGLTWIGPSSQAIAQMGDKVAARAAMAAAGVPVLPGTDVLSSEAEVLAAIDEIGLPVIMKAAAGGGGRGMKIVRERAAAVGQWQTARTEAQAAFGDGSVYLERYLERPRHIEVQIIADTHGQVMVLGDRDCSTQRRHQKVIEEAPGIDIAPQVKASLFAASRRAAEAIGYVNAGTLEFLLDGDGSFYFMEMNTRLQVEHPVTEMVFGIDLVREQLAVAGGERLTLPQRAAMSQDPEGHLTPRGHAIEFRINAEDPETFAPWPGRITGLHFPGGLGVRIDTHVYQSYVVPPNYDSLLAKVIVHDHTRAAAVARAKRALAEVVIEGIRTNVPFLRELVECPEFVAGGFDTGLVGRVLARKKRGLR